MEHVVIFVCNNCSCKQCYVAGNLRHDFYNILFLKSSINYIYPQLQLPPPPPPQLKNLYTHLLPKYAFHSPSTPYIEHCPVQTSPLRSSNSSIPHSFHACPLRSCLALHVSNRHRRTFNYNSI